MVQLLHNVYETSSWKISPALRDRPLGMQMDKEGAQPDRVKQELSDAGLLPEEWGGQTPMIQACLGLRYP